MRYFKSEGEFWEYYKRFNALYGEDWYGWKPTQARTKLEDMFGTRISAGEMYFKKPTSYDYGSDFRLSIASMEKLLLIVMVQNRELNEVCEKIIRRQGEERNTRPQRESPQVLSLGAYQKPSSTI